MNVATSWLDFKLSLRMLTKYPFLTLVAGLATTFAIGAAALYFEVANDVIHPKLPLEDGGSVVEIHNEDLAAADAEPRSLHDFQVWRQGLRTVRELAAFTETTRNLGPLGGPAEPQKIVEIGAAAFRVARITPLMGRPLVDADEQDGAAPVVVIGERLWESRFDRDPGIVGKPLQIGDAVHTVVGVMPETFALPVNHTIWVPLRTSALAFERRQGPAIGTIGRLAPGASLEEAQAELTVLGNRIAAEFPATNERLRPRVAPYLDQYKPETGESTARLGANAIFMMLLSVICANVGALIFARVVTREKEFSVRTALGASRGRIVMQLFVEALLLTTIGATVALVVVRWGLRRGESFISSTHNVAAPFWRDAGLSGTTVLYVAVLAVLGALFMGGLPALKFTRGSVEASLRRSATGGSGMRSRRMSTAVIVLQVALAGALLPVAVSGTLGMNWSEPTYPGIRTSEYLTVRYGMERPTAAATADSQSVMSTRMAATQVAMKQRLLAEPGVAGVTFAQQLPGSTHFPSPIEVAEDGGKTSGILNVRMASVDADFFETFRTPVVTGRGFRASDVESNQRVVVVNQPFVKLVLGGRNAVGRRVRFPSADGSEPGEWYEIVGVVPDLGMNPLRPDMAAGLYRLATPGNLVSGMMAVRVEGGAAGSAQTFRSIAAGVDKGFLIYETRPMNQVVDSEVRMDRAFALLLIGGSFFIVLLSAAVTFALMSFTVSQRNREIGIYRALGAGPRAVLTSVFSRAFIQLGLGAGLGTLASFLVSSQAPGSSLSPVTVVGTLVVMLLVGLASCGAPALRALRIEPTLAMREDT